MRRQKVKATDRSHDWSNFIVQHTPGAVITADARGRITEFNPAAERLTGYSREEALGRQATEILNCEGADSNCSMDLFTTGLSEITRELTLKNRSGQQVAVMVSSFALRDGREGPQGGAIIIRDLTPVKRLEEERQQMVNMFAHDLKTPVVGSAGLIRRMREGKAGPISEAQKGYLETIAREMARVEKIITSFLEFARLDLRILTPVLEDLQAVEYCREVMALLLPLAEVKGIILQADFPREEPVLQADPLLFRRVLENLLENAIKYGPPHSTVKLEVRGEDSGVFFAIKDQGPGIAPEDLPHLFEVFYRGKGAGRESGYGLGLATVKRIIDAHGGRIWVDTAPEGTTFFFTFPLEVQGVRQVPQQ